MIQLLGVVIIVVTIYAVARRVEVRLVLLLAGLALALVGGAGAAIAAQSLTPLADAPAAILRTFVSRFSDEKFVVPICSAMGFAYVLRETECDRHLVLLLTRPFSRIRALLIPGAVLVGFFVNIPLISQTSTAVAVGTVLVPLLRAARLAPATIAAALVLGSSLGGELLNQAAPELLSVARALQVKYPNARASDCVTHVNSFIWVHLAVATGMFWAMTWWRDRKHETALDAAAPEDVAVTSVNPIKALVPFVPLAILVMTSPAIGFLTVPSHWLADTTKPAEVAAIDSRLIGAAMLAGVAAAALTTPRRARTAAATFFEGAGYGFTHIIALIVAASCFGEGIKQVGLNAVVGGFIERHPAMLLPLAALVPLLFALMSGSGMAATQSLFEFFIGPIEAAGADPNRVGAVVSIGAAAGRTMSPVAAVNLMSSKMAGCDPLEVSRRVALPLLAGTVVVIAMAMWRS